jgi:glycerol-3-phosphate acyltransferase PlsY
MLTVILGYLAGSVPFAFLLARRAGIDVRVVGSGNVGAANVLRSTGPGRAMAVIALDVAKGAAAVACANLANSGAALAALSGFAGVRAWPLRRAPLRSSRPWRPPSPFWCS